MHDSSVKHWLSLVYIILLMFGFQLILSLEERLMELTVTLQDVRDSFLEKSADLDVLQKKADDQVRL